MLSTIQTWLRDLRDREARITIILSVVIGALVGLVTVAFLLLTGRLASHLYPPTLDQDGLAPWRRLSLPVAGSLAGGFLLYRYFPSARGSGIPQTKFALFIDEGFISLKTVAGKFLCCTLSLSSGLALGREGPSVQIGAGIASALARHLGLSRKAVKALVPVGAAAALAAAFNTPIAAVLFTLEEIIGDLNAPLLGSVVVSAATSWIVLHLFLGDDPIFHVPAYRLVHPVEFGIYAVLGVIGGLVSVVFVKMLLGIRLAFRRLPPSTLWLQPVAGGLLVGLLGWHVPEVLGVGYEYVDRVVNGDVVLPAVLLLLMLKLIATAGCYSSGNAGGVFGPSLFFGAMAGGAVGSVAHSLFPAYTATAGAYALVGMGATFAGIIRVPFTSVIMIFELTRDYSVIVPLMIANLVSYFLASQLQHLQIYEALALQDGIHLATKEAREAALEGSVRDAMRSGVAPLAAATTAGDAPSSDLALMPVVDDAGLAGLVARERIEQARADGCADQLVSTLMHGDPPRVFPDETPVAALQKMGSSGYNVLPVVSRANVKQLIGVVTLHDILERYGLPKESL